MNIEFYRRLESDGLITLRANPSNTLFIANYTPKVQYEKLWDAILVQCRGLIINNEGTIVARPFSKFFNIEELEPADIPLHQSFQVFDKMDGSLGILYDHKDQSQAKIATRGSFTSDQAIKATQLLHSKYAMYLGKFNPEYTYMFEIIYPENRIVCNYGTDERLVLLSVIETYSGREMDINDVDFPDVVFRYDGIKDISQIKSLEDDTKEGVVLLFKNGFRMKCKFSEYVRLHRIITNVSAKSIWDILKDGRSVSDILDKVPDEFYNWVKKVENDLKNQYAAIVDTAHYEFYRDPDRKSFAEYAKTQSYPHLLFALYDNKDIEQLAWKMIKPQYEKPFITEI